MAKRTVYICDGDGGKCGAVLVNPDDGYLAAGTITTTTLDGEPKVLVSVPGNPDDGTVVSLCRDCMAKALGLSHT